MAPNPKFSLSWFTIFYLVTSTALRWTRMSNRYALRTYASDYTRYPIYHSPGRRCSGLPMELSTPFNPIPDMQYTIHQDACVLAFLWKLVRPSVGTTATSKCIFRVVRLSAVLWLPKLQLLPCARCYSIIKCRSASKFRYAYSGTPCILLKLVFTLFHEICTIYCFFVLKFALVLD